MKKIYFLSHWVKRFLLEYIINEKNLAYNTQCSYRDMFQIFLTYLAKIKRKKIEYLMIDDISAVTIKKFLNHLELDRHSCTTTRNQRLAAIHVFAQFVGLHNPNLLIGLAKLI